MLLPAFHPTDCLQSTGVINNLPPRLGEGPPTSGAAAAVSGTGLGIQKDGSKITDQDAWAKSVEERECGKAAELALREVLGSIDAAR